MKKPERLTRTHLSAIQLISASLKTKYDLIPEGGEGKQEHKELYEILNVFVFDIEEGWAECAALRGNLAEALDTVNVFRTTIENATASLDGVLIPSCAVKTTLKILKGERPAPTEGDSNDDGIQ